MPDPSLLPVGRIRKAHGIKGEVSVDYHADSPELLSEGVYLQRDRQPPSFYGTDTLRIHHGSLLLRLTGIQDRNAAELLRGATVLIPGSRLPHADEDTPYLYQILGLRVIAQEDDGTQTEWGTLSAVAAPAGQELWTISQEGEQDILFPATPELVLGFDLDERCVRIAPPPGLKELYRS